MLEEADCIAVRQSTGGGVVASADGAADAAVKLTPIPPPSFCAAGDAPSSPAISRAVGLRVVVLLFPPPPPRKYNAFVLEKRQLVFSPI